jgi:hypothetical protein
MMTNTDTTALSQSPHALRSRVAATGSSASILADVYRDEVNIAIWQRQIDSTLQDVLKTILACDDNSSVSMTVSPQSVVPSVSESLARSCDSPLVQDIASLVHMFCDLFELNRVGLRLATLQRAMCPRFHTDRVPCRLVTTYSGVATEWLPHGLVDRSKLGPGSKGRDDADSGLYSSHAEIEQVSAGDVALLKGDGWIGNEGAGLVHRSPAVPAGERRLLLTLDFCS